MYRKQRNYVTKLSKQSLQLYFFERCSGGPKSKDFWPTIKPFLSSKSSKSDCDIILLENDTLVSDQNEVSTLYAYVIFIVVFDVLYLVSQIRKQRK